eukprot:CAMPEP_0206000170 /NCGR_PEP_ID=MMETSP1464-20131121/1306_1 /ASSEMBLY_ACC=CAM_ASM_001124 /TAXON_ID=119497 /ORGANISM="Exanthemachrysis gayraliae, Strain RCC1523" /LENGTH=66 /DNA_ID=CAMNT_0053373417 /DNA_START=35 /DNA_END=232 /DNA_ORIENTATION=+
MAQVRTEFMDLDAASSSDPSHRGEPAARGAGAAHEVGAGATLATDTARREHPWHTQMHHSAVAPAA